MLISEDNVRQFREEGYFTLPQAIPKGTVGDLCAVCDHYIEEFNTSRRLNEADDTPTHGGELYTRVNAEGRRFRANILNIKNDRYFLEQRHEENATLRDFIFGLLMAEICLATLGPTAYFHFDEFVVKYPHGGAAFSWHQDGAYVPKHRLPYVSVWCALDPVTEENGTIYVLPYSRAGTREYVEHVRDPSSHDKVSYFGDDPGIPAVLPAGGVAVFASNVLHRSGANTSGAMRRALLTQYSAEPILTEDGTKPWHSADPFLKDGRLVTARMGSS